MCRKESRARFCNGTWKRRSLRGTCRHVHRVRGLGLVDPERHATTYLAKAELDSRHIQHTDLSPVVGASSRLMSSCAGYSEMCGAVLPSGCSHLRRTVPDCSERPTGGPILTWATYRMRQVHACQAPVCGDGKEAYFACMTLAARGGGRGYHGLPRWGSQPDDEHIRGVQSKRTISESVA